MRRVSLLQKQICVGAKILLFFSWSLDDFALSVCQLGFLHLLFFMVFQVPISILASYSGRFTNSAYCMFLACGLLLIFVNIIFKKFHQVPQVLAFQWLDQIQMILLYVVDLALLLICFTRESFFLLNPCPFSLTYSFFSRYQLLRSIFCIH